MAAGNDIRTWSRTRVHRDFFPHYIDQPLLFPSRCGAADSPSNWPSAKLDYILLSALSSSPNQLYYMPTKSGIPTQDKAEIRKWLDWGRKHIEYLKVRKDLPDWPAAGKVDGSAHIIGDRGLIFLFNPGKTALSGEFALTEESIGLKGTGNFQVRQEYPARDQKVVAASGQTVHWEVPAETAVVLRVQPVLPLHARFAENGDWLRGANRYGTGRNVAATVPVPFFRGSSRRLSRARLRISPLRTAWVPPRAFCAKPWGSCAAFPRDRPWL